LKPALLIVALVLLIRLPLLNEAVQGDDVYYLAAATHAQIDPFHPNHVHYIFEGRDVDFRGYPHPPLNAWCLAALIAIFGAVSEIPFHAAYILFSLLAAWATWSLAKRFSPQPLLATLIALVTPAFVINGNSFESDIPFLAFWLSGIAVFISAIDRRSPTRLLLSSLLLILASLTAMQVVLAVPILAVYTWLHARRWPLAWASIVAPLFGITAWQTFERLTDGQFPALVSAGYQQAYGYQRLALKLRNAAALSVHALFLVFPPLLVFLPTWRWMPMRWMPLWCWPMAGTQSKKDRLFLISYSLLFFLGAIAFFFAGSARYLLPMAAPIAILISTARPLFLKVAFFTYLPFSLLLATANYQHWNQTRTFAQSLPHDRRIWVNAEWGLRHYLEDRGALPVRKGQQIPPGDLVVSSELAYPVAYSHAGSIPVITTQQSIHPAVPLRLIGLDTHSAYSTASKGLLPFGISNGTLDRLRAETLVPKLPAREYIDLALPDANDQIASGIYAADGNPWRWMAKSGTFLLKQPATPTPIQVRLYIPDAAPARTISITLDNKPIATQTFLRPGTYTIQTKPESGTVLTVTADQTFSVPSDHRTLGIILTGAGFLAASK